MRTYAVLMGRTIAAACSVDHVTVAALDDASGGEGWGGVPAADPTAGGAGFADPSAETGGVAASGAWPSDGDAGSVSSTTGGEPLSVAGAGAGISFTRCSCLEEKTQFCGSDGVTYPIECAEGDVCLPPSVDCWHACPCLPGEQGTGVTSSCTVDCTPTTPCAGDVVCMTFTNVSPDSLTGCGGASP
jgi:hypothetical protein